MASLAAQRSTRSRASASLRGLASTLSQLSLSASSSSTAAAATKTQTSSTFTSSVLSTRRAFSTSPAHLTKTIALHRLPSDPVPAYPYGPRLLYKQSNSGLYGTSRIRHGNNISKDNKVKTPRAWRPNIHRKRLWSPALGAWVRARLSLRVLRTIRKEGGIDNYVLGHKPARVKELGPGGWKLRWLVMQTKQVRARMDAERERLGVKPGSSSNTGIGGNSPAWMPGLEPDSDDLVRVMLDAATPGPLSARSRQILADRAEQVAAMEQARIIAQEAAASGDFALGEEAEVPDDMLAEDLEAEDFGAGAPINDPLAQEITAKKQAAAAVADAAAQNAEEEATRAADAELEQGQQAAPSLAEQVQAAMKKGEQQKK